MRFVSSMMRVFSSDKLGPHDGRQVVDDVSGIKSDEGGLFFDLATLQEFKGPLFAPGESDHVGPRSWRSLLPDLLSRRQCVRFRAIVPNRSPATDRQTLSWR
jgi:hypothetical protein